LQSAEIGPDAEMFKVMRHTRRIVSAALLIIALSPIAAEARLAVVEDHSQALDTLRIKADLAQPRDKCFLYAKLVSQLTELAGKQSSAGNYEDASGTVVLVRQYAEEIHLEISDDDRRLKDAELLVQHSIFRLEEILHGAPNEDRITLQTALEQLGKVQAQLLTEVFKK
jgi:hypothetical protein